MKRFICFVLSTVLTMMMCVPIHDIGNNLEFYRYKLMIY